MSHVTTVTVTWTIMAGSISHVTVTERRFAVAACGCYSDMAYYGRLCKKIKDL